jgi:hypothetical protein
VYFFAFIEAYRAVLDLTEIRLSDWGVAQVEVGREAHVLACGGKDAENSPPVQWGRVTERAKTHNREKFS